MACEDLKKSLSFTTFIYHPFFFFLKQLREEAGLSLLSQSNWGRCALLWGI